MTQILTSIVCQAALAIALLGTGASRAAAQAGDFSWSGALGAGQTIEIKGVNGDIEATGSSSGNVEVTATKRGGPQSGADVRIDVVPHAGGVTICAVYPSQDGRPNQCAPGNEGRLGSRNNDTQVFFTVKVPAGVGFTGRIVNGGVDATGLSGPVAIRTVNGAIRMATAGTGSGETVNGSIDAQIGELGDGLTFKTVNGSVTLTLPDATSATIDSQTVNGGIASDFPLTIRGEFGPRSAHGTIGGGGPQINVKTVNGRITFKRT